MPEPDAQPPALTAMRHGPALGRFLATMVLLLAADLISKQLAFEHVAGQPVTITRDADGRLDSIPPHDDIPIVPSILSLQLTLNEGAVFGIGQGRRWVFIAFGIIAVIIIAMVFAKSGPRRWGLHLALGAVLAGALGNFWDRLLFGAVRDLFHLFPGVQLPFGWNWPDGSRELYPWIFNIADVALVLGAIVLAFLIYRSEREEAKSSAATN